MKLLSIVTGQIPEVKKVDPATFKDPLALKISWEPLKKGGTNIRSHYAVQVNGNRVEFKKTLVMKLFLWFLLLFPSLIILFLIYDKVMYADWHNFSGETVLALCITIPVMIIPFFLFLTYRKSIIFDRSYNYYWKGNCDKKGVPPNFSELKEKTQLNQIHALQIISELVRTGGHHPSRYRSYELNLILKSGERLNVVDHGKYNALEKDVLLLSRFLGVPVWDATK